MSNVNDNNNSIKNTTTKENLIHDNGLIERGHDLFTIKEEKEPLLSDNIHNTLNYNMYSYLYPKYAHPKNYIYYKNVKGVFLPFIMCFLPFVNAIMLTFVLYSISQINNVASILSDDNFTNTVTKIEHIINYLCENNIVKC